MEAERIMKGATLIISDAHLCAGERLPNGKPNVHELFKSDHALVQMVRSFSRDHAAADELHLVLNGDIIDFHAIPYNGSFRCVPTEEAALDEFQHCVEGHQRSFSAFGRFVQNPKATLWYVIGNHDQEFAWPAMQEAFKRRLDPTGAHWNQIRFVREVRIGKTVLIRHGDQLDPISALPEGDDMFITGKVAMRPAVIAGIALLFTFPTVIATTISIISMEYVFSWKSAVIAFVGVLAGLTLFGALVHKIFFWKWGREKRFLNVPTSTYMNSWLGQRLRAKKPWIGRMQNHGALWFLSLVHSWQFALAAIPLLLVYFLYHRFVIEYLSVRRQASLVQTLKLLASTTHADRPEVLLPEVAAKYPEVKHFIFGHTHAPDKRVVTLGEREIVYWNTGTMVSQIRVVRPLVETSSGWPRVEAFFKRIGFYWKERTGAAILLTLVHLLLAAGAFELFRYLDWTVSAHLILALATFSLLWRKSYAQYRGEEFVEFTPIIVKEFGDGTKEVRQMNFNIDDGTWTGYHES